MIRSAQVILIAALVAAGAVWPADAADAVRGRLLAEQWCSSCHVIAARGPGRPTDMAPPWPEIAADPARTPERLRQRITTGYRDMPNLDLGRREVDDLVAYIQSLRPVPK